MWTISWATCVYLKPGCMYAPVSLSLARDSAVGHVCRERWQEGMLWPTCADSLMDMSGLSSLQTTYLFESRRHRLVSLSLARHWLSLMLFGAVYLNVQYEHLSFVVLEVQGYSLHVVEYVRRKTMSLSLGTRSVDWCFDSNDMVKHQCFRIFSFQITLTEPMGRQGQKPEPKADS